VKMLARLPVLIFMKSIATVAWVFASSGMRKVCIRRGRAGEIPFFTSIDSPYEAPKNPKLVTWTDSNQDKSVDEVFKYIQEIVKL
jgi:adenylylsulfate kinase-like enzyme